MSFVPSKTNNPKDDKEAEEAARNLLVEDPENVDFHAKRKAFYAIGEKMKTNDTFQTFKAKKEEVRRVSSTCSLEKTEGDNDRKDSEEAASHVTQNQNSGEDKTVETVVSSTNSEQKGLSICVPLLLCVIVGLMACVVACLVEPGAAQKLRTFIEGLNLYQNGKIAS